MIDDIIIESAGNKIKIYNMPFSNGSKIYNEYFLKLCELIEPKTNRLCIGLYENGKMKPATEQKIAFYLDVRESEIRKVMHRLRKLGVFADFKTEDKHVFIINPLYATHIDGVYKSVQELFDIGDIETYSDTINKQKRAILRAISERDEKERKENG
ncbi:MAG: hypothetical protein EOM05_09285 [Clostridia bacterium]|nr:hypothetical protein [Clostridia bacterium]